MKKIFIFLHVKGGSTHIFWKKTICPIAQISMWCPLTKLKHSEKCCSYLKHNWLKQSKPVYHKTPHNFNELIYNFTSQEDILCSVSKTYPIREVFLFFFKHFAELLPWHMYFSNFFFLLNWVLLSALVPHLGPDLLEEYYGEYQFYHLYRNSHLEMFCMIL